jgi:hypothetical protein
VSAAARNGILPPLVRHARRTAAIALSAACLAAAASAATVPDLRLAAGRAAQGEISFPGEEDRVAVELLAGQKLTFTAKASRRSALRPNVDLYDVAGAAQSVDAKQRVTKPTLAAVNLWPVPATGTYLLGVRAAPGGSTGLYDLTTKARPAPKPKFPAGSFDAVNEVDEFAFDAFAGSKLTVTLKRSRGSTAVPRVLSVIAPDGTSVPLDGAVRKSTVALDLLKNVVLPQFGGYRIRVQGSAGTVGGYTVTIAVKAPALAKGKLDFRGASGGEATAGEITSVAVAPASAAVAVGKTTQFVAMATYADGRVRDATRVATWGSRDPGVASVANGATPGLATGLVPGGAVVHAWAGHVESREALALVGGATVTGVTVLPAAPVVALGDTITLAASATMSTGDPVDATNAADWSAGGAVALALAGPRVTAGSSAGTAQVTATLAGVPSAALDVTVTAARIERIVVSPPYKELASGSQAYTATATYSDGSSADVTSSASWASDNLAAATMSGATATFVAAGTAGVRATLDGVTSRECVLNCGPVLLSSVTVAARAGVPKGATRDFAASGAFADGGTRDLTEAANWSSNAATTVSVSTTRGIRGRATGVADSGTATLTASVPTAAGTRSGNTATAASAAERASLFVVPRLATVGVGGTTAFRAFAALSDGTFEDVTASSVWTTSNPAAATTTGGVVTGVADGGAALSASLGGRTAHAVATVGAGRVTGLAVDPADPSPIGETGPAVALATFAPSVGGDPAAVVTSAVAWLSSDPLASPVDAAGTVSARRVATSKLSASLGAVVAPDEDVSGVAAVERALRVFPQAAHGVADADVQLAAQTTSSDGSVADRASTSAWSSETESTATISATGLVHAVAKGTTRITVSRPASALSDTKTFSVSLEPPSISSVSSATLVRGTSGNVVVVNGAGLDGPSRSVTFSGTGVTAAGAPVPNGDGTQATVSVNVSGGAAPGARDLTYTTSLGFATLANAVVVANTPPTISSVAPTNIDVPVANSTATTLTVTGTGFAAGDTFSLAAHSGVSLTNVQIVNSTTMTGTVTVQSTAAMARLDVVVTQSAGAGGQTATLTAGLKIGPADATISGVSPTHALLYPHTVTGQIVGTNFGAGVIVTVPGSGTAIANFAYIRQSPTLITIQFDVIVNAAAGAFDIVLQNEGDIPRTFTGRLVVVPADPTVATFSAASLGRGVVNLPVEIVGTNFLAGDGVSASGTGVTFSGVGVVSSEKITANVSVASGATVSLRDLVVSHASGLGGRGGTLRNAFRVADATPTVVSCNPPRIGRTGSTGPTRRVPITVTGTNFSAGATASVSLGGGSGLTVVANSTTVVSDTQLVFSVDIAGSATVGAWSVVVANPSPLGNSGASGAGALTVSSEATLTVNRVVSATGSALGGERVTIYGAGFAVGLVVDFGTEKATGAQFIDQNTAVCTVPPPANPASPTGTSASRTQTTFVTVKVTNPVGGANASLTNGYGYLANSTVFKILSSFPADGSTGVPKNLRSAVMRLSDYANTTTAVFGTTQGVHCQWFEGVRPNGQYGGFGADRRFLVFSWSGAGGGNLPAINPPPNTGKYIVETPTAVKSSSGTPLTPAKLAAGLSFDQWLFTISTTATDTTAPTIANSTPGNGATSVPTNTSVSLTFSEELDPLTVTTTTFSLAPQGGSALPCSVSLSSDIKTVTLTPQAELAAGATYVVSIGGVVADLCANTFTAATRTFTTGAGPDTTAPTIDSVVFEQIPASMDGSTTYVAGTDTPAVIVNGAQAFRLYLPRYGWKVSVAFSDSGGSGVDETQFSAKANVASGSTASNGELASKFVVTSTGAEWTVAAADLLDAGDNATLTFTVKDKAGTPNTSTAKIVSMNLIDIGASAVGAGGSPGGDLNPFDARETWVLRFDRDVYTATRTTTGTPPTGSTQVTTTAAANGVLDLEEALRISGLATASMTTDAANTTNGISVGTNAIVLRIVQERIRATLRARFGIAEDGTRGADAADIEFLLPGEQGSLPSPPIWSSASNGASSKAFSEMDIGGDTGPNSSPTGTFAAIGFAFLDPRNRNREADMNDGLTAGQNNGIFAINMAKFVMNVSVTGTNWGVKVLSKFQTAKGGTPIGEGALDDDVLSGAYDRTSSSASNTQAMKDRYDQIMDALELSALSLSSVAAHEIGHSIGLVPDVGPKTGFFGNAHKTNAFTEATASLPNTTSHMNYLGNDIMAPVSSVDQYAASGSDLMKFSPYDRDYLLRRQVHDEGR